MTLERRIKKLENRVDRLERKRLTVSRSELTRVAERAMIQAFERSMLEQLRRQGKTFSGVDWKTPCTLIPNWDSTPDVWRTSGGDVIHLVD